MNRQFASVEGLASPSSDGFAIPRQRDNCVDRDEAQHEKGG
jgi:hypothetical protein